MSLYAAQAGGGKVPLWGELVRDLEASAKIAPYKIDVTFPDRLDLILHALRRENFQSELRKRVHDPLASSLLAAARAAGKNTADPIPREVRRIAKLGTRANPVVNFNIETMTSLLLGGYEPHAVKCFVPPVPGASDLLSGHGQYTGGGASTHNRALYHPHGAISVGGVCVMTSSEYRAMRGTLALQLAVHAAFRTRLAIVGMSLDDEYLRHQLGEFREQVDQVMWFRPPGTRLPSDVEHWCTVNRIEVIDIGSWRAFWDEVDRVFPAAPEQGLALNWMQIISQASAVLSGHRHEGWVIGQLRKMGVPEHGLVGWKQTLLLKGLPLPEISEEDNLEPFAPTDEEAFVPILDYIHKLS